MYIRWSLPGYSRELGWPQEMTNPHLVDENAFWTMKGTGSLIFDFSSSCVLQGRGGEYYLFVAI